MCTNDSNSDRGSKTSSPLWLPSNKRLRRDECVLGTHQITTGDDVIRAINPKIIGWCNYYKNAVSTRAFQKLEQMLWYKIFSWAKRKHPKKSAKWVFEKYHKRTGKAWS